MIVWLLCLFPFVRYLRAECARLREALQASSTEKLILQDRLDSTMNDRSELWRMMETAISNERQAYQMGLNVEWQKRGFGAPYPDAPKLPTAAIPAELGGGTAGAQRPEMASTRVARATQQFIDGVIAQRAVSQ